MHVDCLISKYIYPMTYLIYGNTEQLNNVSYRLMQIDEVILIWYDIFVNCNWADTRWKWFSTHLRTNNAYDNTIDTNILF